VLEVLSPDRPARDLEGKRRDYAEVAIPEYWIVDPERETISVLALRDGQYETAGVFDRERHARSIIVADFTLDTATIFDVV